MPGGSRSIGSGKSWEEVERAKHRSAPSTILRTAGVRCSRERQGGRIRQASPDRQTKSLAKRSLSSQMGESAESARASRSRAWCSSGLLPRSSRSPPRPRVALPPSGRTADGHMGVTVGRWGAGGRRVNRDELAMERRCGRGPIDPRLRRSPRDFSRTTGSSAAPDVDLAIGGRAVDASGAARAPPLRRGIREARRSAP